VGLQYPFRVERRDDGRAGGVGIAQDRSAYQNGFEARFATADELMGELSRAAQRSRLEEALEPYVHPHVLVIDELGYQSYAADAAHVLFRVVSG